MTLITEEYRALQENLHGRAEYGVTAPRFMRQIAEVAATYRVDAIIDYGSGPREHVRKALGNVRGVDVRSYDPGVPALAVPPRASAMLVSCDVLEHIEPHCLDAVLKHMGQLTLSVAFLTIATGPAKKTLADGRNAHLIQEGSEFWLPRVMQWWKLKQFHDIGHELICIGEARVERMGGVIDG